MLARPAEEITLKEIVEAAEGKISIVDCVRNPESCETVEGCPTRNVWARLEDHITGFLEGITLQEIVEEYRQEHGPLMYHI